MQDEGRNRSSYEIWSAFRPWIRPEWRRIVGSIVVMVFAALFKLAEPWPLKWVIDRLFANEPESASAGPWLAAAVLALVGIVAGRASLDFAMRVEFAKIGNRVLRRIRARVFDHVQRLSLAFHAKRRSGDLTIRLTRDVSLLRDATATSLLPLIANVLVLGGMSVVVFALQWRLALLVLVWVPALAWITTRTGRGLHRAARRQRNREGELASAAAESVQAIQDVQAMSLAEKMGGALARHDEKNLRETLRSAKLSAGLTRNVDLFGAIALGAVLGYGSLLVLDAKLTPGALVVFMTYLKRALKPAKDFAKHSGRLAKASAAGARVLALLDRKLDVADAPDAIEAPAFRGAIRFRDVEFRYDRGDEGLTVPDLEIRPGERVAIAGPSGSGKTSLIRLLLRLYDPRKGTVEIDGTDIRRFTLDSLRRQIAVVLHDAVLFSGTIAENIAIGVDGTTPEAIRRAAKSAGAHAFVAAFPDGYDTEVGERGVTLSRGQRQRIALARALLREAPILVLDEPTSGLDGQNVSGFLEALDAIPRHVTVLYATHDSRLVARAERTIRLDAGVPLLEASR